MTEPSILFFDGPAVRAKLDPRSCIGAVRDAMRALSAGTTRQLLRTMIPMGERRTFALMPGALAEDDFFGAKLIAVFPTPGIAGRRAHRGVVVLFEPTLGHPVCVADAEQITLIRTAAASAVATDALARRDASRLAILGTGAQAAEHVRALSQVRDLRDLVVWGRSYERAEALAARLSRETGLTVSAMRDAEAAVADADIVCTLTGSPDPILLGRWVRAGTHVNVVGSSGPGPTEIDSDLVVRSRFVADSRASVLAQGSEFLVAKAVGLVDDDHIVAEIGEVLLGTSSGRRDDREITLYKSLGHAVQDLAAVSVLYRQAIGGKNAPLP